jgi:hypothetical protein
VDLDELQLRRLVRRKTGVKVGSIRELHSLLLSLEHSPRFELIQGLLLSEFRNSGKITGGSALQLTLGELVAHGALQICGLPSMGGRRIESLIDTLRVFVQQQEVDVEQESNKKNNGIESVKVLFPASVEPKFEPVKKRNTRFISTKVQEEFQEALHKLKNYNQLSKIENAFLKEFWSADDPRAPFEEGLTYRQLLHLDMSALLRKRSLNEQKIKAIINAIEVAIEGKNNKKEKARERRTSTAWSEVFLDATVLVRSFLREIESLEKPFKEPKTLLEAAALLPDVLSARECVAIFLKQDYSDLVSAEIMRSTLEEYIKTSNNAHNKITQVLQVEYKSLFETWREMLSGPGAYGTSLILPFRSHSKEIGCTLDWFEHSVLKVLLNAVGAREWSLQGRRVTDFYTLDSNRLFQIFGMLSKSLPKSNTDFHEACDLLMSNLRRDHREELFSLCARFDHSQDSWFVMS